MTTVIPTPRPEILVIPLAEVNTEMLFQFTSELANEPRYFGKGAIPKPSARWRSMLCHPARVQGVAALLDGNLVGVARLSPRPHSGVDLYAAVAAPWRRQGIGAQLVEAAIAMATQRGEPMVAAVAEHRKAAVRALARRYFADSTIIRHGTFEFIAKAA